MSIISSMPLYALRAYERLYTKGDYLLIDTQRTTHVLDKPSLGGTYAERRLLLACTQDLPYKLYNLKERFTTIPQLVNTKRRVMIDNTGKVFKYKPSLWLRVEYTKVLRCDQTWKGTYRLVTKLNTVFLSTEPTTYIGYIREGHSLHLYEMCDELKKTRRIKI